MSKDVRKGKLGDLCDILKLLEELIQARVTENTTVAKKLGMTQEQHTQLYRYYRSLVWKAQEIAEKEKRKKGTRQWMYAEK